MSWRNRACGTAAAVLAMAISSPARADVLYVDDDISGVLECFGAPYRTITRALKIANAGDEIRICPGSYPEQVVLDRPVRLTGIPEGTVQPRISPTALPESRPSLLGGNAVTAAILIDNEWARISNIEVDLSNATVAGCLPLLTGIYLRRASGLIERTRIVNVRVAGRPACDSGVGLYIESGNVGEILGKPVSGAASVRAHDVEFAGYQKAGLVASGPRTRVTISGGGAVGSGPTAGAVQYGYQIGFGASGTLTRVVTSGHDSLIAGKASAGVLGFQSAGVSVSRSEMSGSQVGVLGIGDLVRVKRSSFSDLMDGIVFLGHTNAAAGNLIERNIVSAVFVNGNRNTVRGGVIRDQSLGVWFQNGVGNRYRGVRFESVPEVARGVYGGVRWDMTTASAEPFSTACVTIADCDDGNSCTAAVCDRGHCTLTTLAAGSPCDDGVACTTDVCDAAGLCQGTAVPAGTACDDGSACTTTDTCDAAGACLGTAVAAGAACDDGDDCTGGDTCDASGVCAGTPVTVGTACDDGNACTTSDSCDAFGGCRGMIAPTGTACDDGQPCTTGYCSSGSCLGTPEVPGTVCDDGNACTADDTCAAGAVCSGASVPDGTACGTMMSCTAGVCS